MKNVVGLFEYNQRFVKIVDNKKPKQRVLSMYQTECMTCNQKLEKTTTRRRYNKGKYQIIVTNVPCSRCQCEESFSMQTLIVIEKGLEQNEFERDSFISFEELTKGISLN